MGFFMLYWKRYSLLCWLAASLFVLAPARAADGIVIRSAEMRQVEGEYLLYARLSISLTPMLTDALNRGINLYFDTDFDFSLPRWYWFPQQLAHLSRVTRLSYNILLRQYFVSGINVEARSMSTLSEALDYLGQINGWPVISRDSLSKSASYRATLSMQLDTSQLPKPLQINDIATGRWNLDSTPLVWMMTL
jgi:hypothetical protein